MLQKQWTFLIVPCNKNLGPAIIERHDYLKIAMQDHLNDTTTYKLLTSSETDCYTTKADENGMCFHPGGTHIKSVPQRTFLFDSKSSQAETRSNGGPPEKPPNRSLPRQPDPSPRCLGRS